MIEQVIKARRKSLGGFDVGRVLPSAPRRMVAPFVFFDHMGPADLPAGIPRDVDVRPHPHIGLSTLSYLFRGEMTHRDSLGTLQVIRPGAVNWMTAGRGITHSERFERARREGGHLDGIQAWVALPAESEECDPAFTHIDEHEIPSFDEGGARGRLIAGEAFGLVSPVPVFSPLFYVHWTLSTGACAPLPTLTAERAVFVASGRVDIGGESIDHGTMVVFSPGASPAITVLEPTVLMMLGGESIGPRLLDWNFVSSRPERIAQAKADWRAGRMSLPPDDDQEFIPLPAETPATPNPMS